MLKRHKTLSAQHTGSDIMFLTRLSPSPNNWKKELNFLVAEPKRFKTSVQNPIIFYDTRQWNLSLMCSHDPSSITSSFQMATFEVCRAAITMCILSLSVLAVCVALKIVVLFINITTFITRHVKIMKFFFLFLIQNCQIILSLLNRNIFQRALLQTLVIYSLYSGL